MIFLKLMMDRSKNGRWTTLFKNFSRASGQWQKIYLASLGHQLINSSLVELDNQWPSYMYMYYVKGSFAKLRENSCHKFVKLGNNQSDHSDSNLIFILNLVIKKTQIIFCMFICKIECISCGMTKLFCVNIRISG